MTSSPPAPQELISCLNAEVLLVAQFVDALKHESIILESGQPDELVASTHKKEAFATQIGKAVEQRNQLLLQLGYASETAGLQAASKEHPEVSAVVDKLLDLALQARRLNETNGATIALLLRQNQQLIETLQRLASANTTASEVYDASGKSKTVEPPPASQPRLKPVKAG